MHSHVKVTQTNIYQLQNRMSLGGCELQEERKKRRKKELTPPQYTRKWARSEICNRITFTPCILCHFESAANNYHPGVDLLFFYVTIVTVICVPGLAGIHVCLEASLTLLPLSHLLGVSISRFSLAFGGHSRHTQASLSTCSSVGEATLSSWCKHQFEPEGRVD